MAKRIEIKTFDVGGVYHEVIGPREHVTHVKVVSEDELAPRWVSFARGSIETIEESFRARSRTVEIGLKSGRAIVVSDSGVPEGDPCREYLDAIAWGSQERAELLGPWQKTRYV